MPSNVETTYNQWAEVYDSMENKTRDLDRIAAQTILLDVSYSSVLELGCGTAKNTEWLAERAENIVAVDLSEEMIIKAKQKIRASHVKFIQADISHEWHFGAAGYDLITCNLVLEHIQNLSPIFLEASRALKAGGHFFISELHPARQYLGGKARFEKNNELYVPECFTHHISEFYEIAAANGFQCIRLNEWFDDDSKSAAPRLISFLFRKA